MSAASPVRKVGLWVELGTLKGRSQNARCHWCSSTRYWAVPALEQGNICDSLGEENCVAFVYRSACAEASHRTAESEFFVSQRHAVQESYKRKALDQAQSIKHEHVITCD